MLSFQEYLDEFLKEPRRHCRLAARYVADCFEHWGTEEVPGIGGPVTRWKLFDAPFDEGRDRLVGQEIVQREFHQAVAGFARHGRADKLVLLHGPNGSAKSTFCELVFRSLEAYSQAPEGVLHAFNWVFPTREAQGKRLGFADDRTGRPGREETHAYLTQEEIAARIPCELRDPPIFLIPPPMRRELLADLWRDEEARRTERYLFEGEPCAKCRKISDGLLALHRGDIMAVLRHVQVVRWFISQRYRQGAVRISPQTHVDAAEIQVTADRSVQALPAALQDMNLHVPIGDLVDANRGMVEYSDFLKRPLEMNKYLLTTCEKSTINLQASVVHLNTLLVATGNEAQLDDLKKTTFFPSFNARMDLITVPCLLQVRLEREVYAEVIASIRTRKHVAPHVADLAATWAVLCRLHRPDPDHYQPELQAAIRELTPLEKARLYDGEPAPVRLPPEVRALLRAHVGALRDEYRDSLHYEGRYGPSAREMRSVLMDCRYDSQSSCVSPPCLFEQLRRLVRDKTLYEFLRVEPDNGYHDAEALIESVERVHLDTLNAEIRDSMQLVQPDEYRRVFERYVQHVNALRGHERVRSPITGKLEDPDERFIERVEGVIAGEASKDSFREALIGRIGAFRIDHPTRAPDYTELFPEAVEALQEDYYEKSRKIIESVRDNLMRYGTEDLDDLEVELRQRVISTMDNLIGRYGYCPGCAKEAVSFLARHA